MAKMALVSSLVPLRPGCFVRRFLSLSNGTKGGLGEAQAPKLMGFDGLCSCRSRALSRQNRHLLPGMGEFFCPNLHLAGYLPGTAATELVEHAVSIKNHRVR